jgi:hypothetical protein
MNEENPYRSPLAECGGHKASDDDLRECGLLLFWIGVAMVLFSVLWRAGWHISGRQSDPVIMAWAGVAHFVGGIVVVLADTIRRR